MPKRLGEEAGFKENGTFWVVGMVVLDVEAEGESRVHSNPTCLTLSIPFR